MKKKPVIVVAVLTFLSAALAVLFMSSTQSERDAILASFNRTTAKQTVGVNVTQTQQAVEKVKQELPEKDSLLSGITGADSNSSNSSDDADAYVPGATGTGQAHEGTSTVHGHTAFRQSNAAWGSVPLGYANDSKGKGSISNNGCGLCSHAAMLSEFGYKTDPASLINLLESWDPGVGDRMWTRGMQWSFPSYLVSVVNAHPDEFGFKLELVLNTNGAAISSDNLVTLLKENLYGKDDQVVTASTSTGIFTSGGHIICIPCMPDENSFHVVDSSGVACGNNSMSWEEIQDYNWPLNSADTMVGYAVQGGATVKAPLQLNNDGGYQIKCVWVFKKLPK